jgi:hypothetical protein
MQFISNTPAVAAISNALNFPAIEGLRVMSLIDANLFGKHAFLAAKKLWAL